MSITEILVDYEDLRKLEWKERVNEGPFAEFRRGSDTFRISISPKEVGEMCSKCDSSFTSTGEVRIQMSNGACLASGGKRVLPDSGCHNTPWRGVRGGKYTVIKVGPPTSPQVPIQPSLF